MDIPMSGLAPPDLISHWRAMADRKPGSGGFASGITPPSATVNSAATSRTAWPSIGNRSSVRRLVMPETEIAASGSAQSL